MTVVAGGGGGGLFGAVYDNPQPVMTSTAPSAVANKRRHLILSKRIFPLGQKFVNAPERWRICCVSRKSFNERPSSS